MKSHNQRIIGNTIALYFRSFVTIIVSLYTSRIVLAQLGASDYGIYSLVGGVVTFLAFLRTSMVSSTQRFLNFEKGAKNDTQLRRVFGASLLIHLQLAAIIFIFAETVGLWFLNTKLNIEPERMGAANWVFQAAVGAFMVQTMISPFNAAIVANERMKAFAYMGLLETSLRLVTAYFLVMISWDKLKIFSLFTLATSVIMAFIYVYYAWRNFPECRTWPRQDKAIFRKMMSFSSWTITSNLSVILRIQGINILLNLFFGTIVNAALGIATSVNTSIRSFSGNFVMALNPQIVQNYAAGDMTRMRELVLNGCRLSFILALLFSLPALVETEAILNIWLHKVPQYTTNFVQLILIQTLVESFGGALATAQAATGDVKRYHMTLSAIGLLNLPASYLLLVAGMPPYVVLMVTISFSTLIGIVRVAFVRKSIGLSARAFLGQVGLRCSAVTLLALTPPMLVRELLPRTTLISVGNCMLAGLSVIVATIAVGMSGSERRTVARLVVSKLQRAK